MNKTILKDNIEKLPIEKIEKNKILGWVRQLPIHLIPNKPKKGDVYFHHYFRHPVVLIKQKNQMWIGLMLTSNKNSEQIFEPCESRFLDTYITINILSIQPILSHFIGIYDNNSHLNDCYKQIKKLLN